MTGRDAEAAGRRLTTLRRRIAEQAAEIAKDGPVVVAHADPDASPETRAALMELVRAFVAMARREGAADGID